MSYGLTPRPELGADELAALLIAAEEVLTVHSVPGHADPVPNWRFSGRWFNAGPYALRRPYRAT